MPQAPAQHARAPHTRARRTVRNIGIGLVVVLVAVVSVGGYWAWSLYQNIDTVALPGGGNVDIDKIDGGFNMLIVGSDVCSKDEDCTDIGVRDHALNDVTILLHVSEDQRHAVAVSIPRDLVIPIPACPKEDGSGDFPAMSAQPINTTLGYGGLACTALTVEKLSGLDIQFAGLITFNGVIAMTDAVGGVPVCLTGPLDDRYTNLHLTAGTHTLKGRQALQFLRTRHGVGNGSDLTRISSQQVYLSSLVRTLKSGDTLGDPTKVYNLATAATKNMTLSESLADPKTLVSIAFALKDIPLANVVFVQFPSVTDPANRNKVVPSETRSARLWSLIGDDEAFTLSGVGDGAGSVADPSATSSPRTPTTPATQAPATTRPATQKPTTPSSGTPSSSTPSAEPTEDFTGQTAADQTCSVTR
jgi:LCP family protein required for cell wall assembly